MGLSENAIASGFGLKMSDLGGKPHFQTCLIIHWTGQCSKYFNPGATATGFTQTLSPKVLIGQRASKPWFSHSKWNHIVYFPMYYGWFLLASDPDRHLCEFMLPVVQLQTLYDSIDTFHSF